MSKRDEFKPVAEEIYLDNSAIDCLEDAENIQEGFEELCQRTALAASPGIAYGRDGNVSGSVSNPGFLVNNQVFSNRTGVPFGLNDGKLVEIWLGVENPTTCTVRFYWHEGDEINLTTLVDVTLVPGDGRSKTYNEGDLGVINIPKDKQLAAAVISGNGKNLKAFVIASGNRGA